MSRDTAVYRLFDHRDRLLYVGISDKPRVRLAQHAAEKTWWPEVDHASLEWFECRSLASIEEQRAIEDEGPAHNIALPPWRVPDPAAIFNLPMDQRGAALERMRERREDLARAHSALLNGVHEALAKGWMLTRIGRHAGWSREYIAKIRDGKTGGRKAQD